jgi:hypothetical protein
VQLTLDMPELERRSRPVLNLLAYDLIVICSSAGKDSTVLRPACRSRPGNAVRDACAGS